MKKQIHVIDKRKVSNEELKQILLENKNIKFVSLMGVDLGGNATDEKIPVSLFLDDLESFINGVAVQTDGSSVVLPGIATLNNAKVDMIADLNAKWFVDYNYDFIILSKDITPSNKSLLLRNQEKFKNVSIRFIDPSWSLDGLDLFVNQDVYTIDLYYRVVIPHILKNYTKVLVVDADMICRDDLKDLFNTDVSDFLAAGIKDTVFQGQVNGLEPDRVIYTHNYMKMDNAYDYVNTGVLLFNCEKYREKYSLNYLRDFIKKNISKVIVFEQDMLNMLLYKNIKFLDAKWNIYTKSNDWVKERITASPAYSYVNYMRVRDKGNGIVHYANSPKPWQDPKTDFACLWWSYAKQSPYYESFIYDKSKLNYLLKILDVVNWNKNILKYWKYKFLQNFVVGKTKTRYLNKKYYYKARIKNAREFIKNS